MRALHLFVAIFCVSADVSAQTIASIHSDHLKDLDTAAIRRNSVREVTDSAFVIDAFIGLRKYSFTRTGQLDKVIHFDKRGIITFELKFIYNNQGWPVELQEVNNSTRAVKFYRARYEFLNGRPVHVLYMPDRTETDWLYDAQGHIIRKATYPQKPFRSTWIEERIQFDEVGRASELVQIRHSGSADSLRISHRVYSYAQGRPIRIEEQLSINPIVAFEHEPNVLFDEHSRIVRKEWADGAFRKYTYDDKGLVTSVTLSLGPQENFGFYNRFSYRYYTLN